MNSRRKWITTILLGSLLLGVVTIVAAMAVARRAETQVRTLNPLPAEMTLGLRYPVTVELTLPWGQCPNEVVPVATQSFVVASKNARRAGLGWGVMRWHVTYQVAALDVGGHSPQLRIPTHGEHTDALDLGTVVVTGIVDEDPTPVAAPLPDVAEAAEPAWWVFGGILVAVCIAIILRFRLQRGGGGTRSTPGAKFTANLGQLESAGLSASEFDQRLSDLVRAYLSDAWSLPVSTRTTREFLQDMKDRLPAEIWETGEAYLCAADHLKYSPDTDESHSTTHRDAAIALVAASEQALEVQADD